jgi:hypothetical protein
MGQGTHSCTHPGISHRFWVISPIIWKAVAMISSHLRPTFETHDTEASRMKSLLSKTSLETVSFFGILGGIGLLLLSLFSDEMRYLAVPGLAAVMPSLLYGLR